MIEPDITDEQKQFAVKILEGSGFSKLLGMKLESIETGKAVISMEMRQELLQPNGVLHGGATASLIDTAMAYAVITKMSADERASTVDLTVHYLRPHTEGTVTCMANIVRAGKRFFTVSATVVNPQGKEVATAISTYTKV